MWAAIKARLRRTEAEPAPPSTPATTPAQPTTPAAKPATPSGKPPTTAAKPAAIPVMADDSEMFTEGFLGRRLTEGSIEEVLDDLEIVLLQSDVALRVVERLRRDLRKELTGRKLRMGVDAEEAIRTCLERSARSMLERPKIDLVSAIRSQTPKPYTILFVGVNGTGKTTTVAKFAGWLRAQGLSSVIAAGRHLPRRGDRATARPRRATRDPRRPSAGGERPGRGGVRRRRSTRARRGWTWSWSTPPVGSTRTRT